MSIQIDQARYRELWQQADDIERRILNVPLLIDLDEQGWTREPLSQRKLMSLIQYSYGGKEVKKVRDIMQRLKESGVIEARPATPKATKCYYRFTYVTVESENKVDVPQETKSSPDDPPKKERKTSPDLPDNVIELLQSVGIDQPAWHIAQNWAIEDLKFVIDNAQAGYRLKKVANVPGYVVSTLRGGKPTDYYLRLERQQERQALGMSF